MTINNPDFLELVKDKIIFISNKEDWDSVVLVLLAYGCTWRTAKVGDLLRYPFEDDVHYLRVASNFSIFYGSKSSYTQKHLEKETLGKNYIIDNF